MMQSSQVTQLALISTIIAEARPLGGRTKLQKIGYLVNESGWHVFNDYRYHYYGPYSETLSNQMALLVKNDWIREEEIETGKGTQFYVYNVQKKGQGRLASLISRAESQDPHVVQKTRGLVRHLAGFKSDDLEIMATLVFIRKDEGINNDEKLVSRVCELKERFSRDQIRRNLRVFKILTQFSN